MTAEPVSPDEPTRSRRHSWNVALLSQTEPGRRNRRPVDAVFLVAGAIVGARARARAERRLGGYAGRDAEGRSLKVRVLGRDAQGTQRMARQWRSLSYRDPPRSAPVGRLEQVEHEALATLMAARAAVRVPEVVIAALGPEGNALIVTREPDVEPLESRSADNLRRPAVKHVEGASHARRRDDRVPTSASSTSPATV
jgi:hypothetical protein